MDMDKTRDVLVTEWVSTKSLGRGWPTNGPANSRWRGRSSSARNTLYKLA